LPNITLIDALTAAPPRKDLSEEIYGKSTQGT